MPRVGAKHVSCTRWKSDSVCLALCIVVGGWRVDGRFSVFVTAFIAVCGAAKLDRTYLPPSSAETAGGSPGALQTPFARDSFNPGRGELPKGSFTNDFQGVVVDAAAPGTRDSSPGDTGLGAPRVAYGSTHSKVGDAAFQSPYYSQAEYQAGFRQQGNQALFNGQAEVETSQKFQQDNPNRFNGPVPVSQNGRESASNTVTFQSDVKPEAYNYAFQTENGITAEENGITINGVQAQGGFSYTGDDGQVYKVTYTADEGGYRPKGEHLPTPPPIPAEILKSLEQNAKEAAAGLVDDGSYDAAKYNVDNDYTKSESANGKYNDRQPGLGYRQEFDTDASGTFISQKNQAFGSSNFNGKFSPTSQEPLKDTNTPQKNIESFSKNEPNKKLESVSLQRTAIEGRLQILPNISFASKGDNLNKNTDKKELSDDENYARPIFLPSLQITQASNNFFGTKNSYLPPGNQALESHQHLKPAINAYNHLPITSNENRNQPQKNENILIPNNLPSNTFLELSETSVNNGELDLSKQKSLQSSSKNNIQTNYRPGSTLKQSYSNINLFNNQQPTLQPQTDLTTPFEHDPSSNKSNTFSDQQFNPFQLNAASNGLLQQGPNTNQHPTFSQQSYNVGQIVSEYGKPNEGSTNNGKFQTSSTSQHSQTQGSDNSYYYNRPSKPFNVPNENKVTLSTFGSKSNNVPIKQFFVNDYEGSQDRSKVGPLALKPATPVQKDVIHPQFQYNGITQASATSFTSINNKNDNIRTEHSNLQIANNVGQLAKYPSSTFQSENAFSQQSIAIQQPFPQQSGINKGDLSNIQISHYDNSYKTAEHMPSQQFGTEIYEYKKPTEILPISSQTSDIRHPNSQFGDKLKPSAFKTQSSSIPGVGFLNRPNGLQSDFNSNSNSHEFESSRPQTTQNQSVESYQHYINTNRDQGLEENTKNQSFGQFDSQVTKQTHQSAPFTPSFSSLNRKRPDFKQQFSSSSAFRPCCQESTTSNDKFTKQDADNFGLSSPSDVFSENKQITHAKNEFASSNVFRPSCRESTSLNCQTTQKDIIRPDVQIGPIDNRQVTHKHQFKGSSVLRPCCQSITSNSQINEQNSGFQNNQNQQEPISTGNTQIGFQGINTELGLNNQTPLDTLSANFQSHQSFASVQTTSQSFTGAREEFSGPRKPPSFDKSTGYHY